jgi:F-type H+-transporting ATPase subunit b
MFGLDQQTFVGIVIQFVNYSVLAFILTYLLYKPVREFLAKRSARIQDQLRYAESEVTSANALKAEYETAMKGIENEKVTILEEARRQASARTKQKLEDARSEAEHIKERAMHEIELEHERVKDEMKKTIINVSSAMAARFLTRSIDAEAHERLYDEIMSELEEMAWHS